MAPSDRLNQVNKHLNYPAGMLAGQVAIITGAGQGIGAEAARLFANEGAKVVVADIDSSMWNPPAPFFFFSQSVCVWTQTLVGGGIVNWGQISGVL